MSKLILFFTLLLISLSTWALPFGIVPAKPLPTHILSGWSATAYYTINNNSVSPHFNNYIKYLPPHVTQVTADPTIPNLCGATFSLAATGQPGDTCTLELLVTGPVDPHDPDPHHHLFACYKGGLTCTGTTHPLNVSATPSLGSLVAAGYIGVGLSDSPIIFAGRVLSSGQAPNFIYPNLSTAEDSLTMIFGEFQANSCNGNICLAVGRYENETGNDYPLIFYSTLSGQIWNAADITSLLPNGSDGEGLGSTCSGQTCLVVGDYTNNHTTLFPLLLISHDGAASWSLYDTSAYSGGTTTDTVLNGVSCNASMCVTGGGYVPSINTAPLLLYSTDNAQTFNTFNVFSLYPTAVSGEVEAVSCGSTTCLVGGYYEDSTFTDHGFIIGTSDGGATWQDLFDSTVFYFVTSLSCNGAVCTAASSYSGDPDSYAILSSSNSGASWSSFTLGAFSSVNDVNCTGSICTATGTTSSGAVPFLYVTYDNGVTWNLIPGITGTLNQTTCLDSVCIAGGESSTSAPYLLETTDNWVTYNQVDLTPFIGSSTGQISDVAGSNS